MTVLYQANAARDLEELITSLYPIFEDDEISLDGDELSLHGDEISLDEDELLVDD